MDSLISRQAAIDALGEKPLVWDDLSDFDLGKVAQWADDVDAIKDLPSAQLEKTQLSGESTTKDSTFNCISRQDAIDALNMLFKKQVTQFGYEGYEKADEKTQLVCDGISYSIECMMNLPSSQPKIIRCKDCKYMQEDKIFHQCWCNGNVVKPDHFCGYAERRQE